MVPAHVSGQRDLGRYWWSLLNFELWRWTLLDGRSGPESLRPWEEHLRE